jgi:heme-degrading monooxygenase HmoA
MLLILWEYRVRTDQAGVFEEAYGPGGAWAQLFRSAPGFEGTALFRDVADPSRYLTLDRWTSRSSFDDFMDRSKTRYDELDRRFEALTLSETRLLAIELPSSSP